MAKFDINSNVDQYAELASAFKKAADAEKKAKAKRLEAATALLNFLNVNVDLNDGGNTINGAFNGKQIKVSVTNGTTLKFDWDALELLRGVIPDELFPTSIVEQLDKEKLNALRIAIPELYTRVEQEALVVVRNSPQIKVEIT